MRMDSPACINCKLEGANITESRVALSSFGIISHQPIRWYFDLEMENNLNTTESYYYISSVGTLFFNLTK